MDFSSVDPRPQFYGNDDYREGLGRRHATAPGTEPIRQNRDTPPRHVRWLLAGAGLGFILGMGAMGALS